MPLLDAAGQRIELRPQALIDRCLAALEELQALALAVVVKP